jgi:hypothetical protein
MGFMRRIAVFGDGNMMGAVIGPDLAVGLGGFGETVPDALRDLANGFDEHGYSLTGNAVISDADKIKQYIGAVLLVGNNDGCLGHEDRCRVSPKNR